MTVPHRLAALSLATAALLLAAPAGAQECISCWNEKCPDLKAYFKACPATKKAPEERRPAAPAKPAGGCPAGMAYLPGGSFKMGERGDQVSVRAYCLDVTEVTVKAYAACVRAGECRPAWDTVDRPGITESQRANASKYCNVERVDRAEHPVNCVTWHQAESYCKWNGKRLPTEEEWEWAARGAERGTTYPWGSQAPQGQLCWDGEGNDLGKGNRQSTCWVGSYPTGDSPQGVKDLAGNVREWTSTSANDGSVRVDRGGSWTLGSPAYVSAAYRDGDAPGLRYSTLGFRCARTP